MGSKGIPISWRFPGVSVLDFFKNRTYVSDSFKNGVSVSDSFRNRVFSFNFRNGFRFPILSEMRFQHFGGPKQGSLVIIYSFIRLESSELTNLAGFPGNYCKHLIFIKNASVTNYACTQHYYLRY